jgi:SAM-dependent methyltransferase
MALLLPDPAEPERSVLDSYVGRPPSGENATAIFAGEWSSRLPAPYDGCTGTADLFEDARITWASTLIGGFDGLRVLELGPLEAGHTTMLERAGAASVVAVESNVRAYLKCLIVKELLGLSRCSFELGDFVAYLNDTSERFDLCVASGVLYHLDDPIAALALMGRVSDRLLIWTHYYDAVVLDANPAFAGRFYAGERADHDGFEYTRYRQNYGEALKWHGFCGGSKAYCHWLGRQDILGMLHRLGFERIEVGFDHPNHPNGPAFAVVAQR